jgi:hypothetical protein
LTAEAVTAEETVFVVVPVRVVIGAAVPIRVENFFVMVLVLMVVLLLEQAVVATRRGRRVPLVDSNVLSAIVVVDMVIAVLRDVVVSNSILIQNAQ